MNAPDPEVLAGDEPRTTELVPSASIAHLLSRREAVLARLVAARTALAEVDDIVKRLSESENAGRANWYLSAGALVCSRGDAHALRLLEATGIADGMKRFDAEAWSYLMHATGMRSLMDATARAKWDKALRDGDFPELTDANIRSTFAQLHESRGDIFERGVIQCFRNLSWDYKTNQPQKFGRRIVVRAVSGTYGMRGCDELDDLVRAMHVLDGKPAPDHRQGTYALLSRAGLTYSNRAGKIETDYLTLRTFKNLNGHVTFKRPDLIDQMNRIIAKHYPGCLPEPK